MGSQANRDVVVAGPNGYLGQPVTKHLKAAGFNVIILTREPSKEKTQAAFPGFKVAGVDFSSVDTLAQQIREAAPCAQALVSLLARDHLEPQLHLIDAAIEAGIPHIIPSCFATGTRDPEIRKLPLISVKVHMEDYIREKASEGKCTWTGVQTSSFFEFALKIGGFLVNTKGRQGPAEEGNMEGVTRLFDGGDLPLSTTSHDDIGRATAAALLKKDQVLNRDVFVHSAVVTQNKLLQYVKEAAPDRQFPVVHANTAEMEKTAWEKWEAGDHSRPVIASLTVRALMGKGLGHFTSTDNELLGIQQWDDEQLKAFVADIVKGKM